MRGTCNTVYIEHVCEEPGQALEVSWHVSCICISRSGLVSQLMEATVLLQRDRMHA